VSDILKQGVPVLMDLLKTQGVPAVTSSLEKLSSETTEDWQKALLKLGVSLVSDHGPAGLSLLESTVNQLQNGGAVDLSNLSMKEASDVLAIMQRREADYRNQVALYTKLIIDTIGKALVTLVQTLFKEIKL
jgi:hypothetical protein